MEPRPLGRGMQLRGELDRRELEVLQWSHDLSVVECLHAPGGTDVCVIASMEPRPLGRGMLQRAGEAWEATGFNGATTSRSWNDRRLAQGRTPLVELQWSHDLSVVE